MRNLEAQLAHGLAQVLGAAAVVAFEAELAVALRVAGGEQHVVDAARAVLGEVEQRPAALADEDVARPWAHVPGRHPRVHRREPFAEIGREREEVGALAALRAREPESLTGSDAKRSPVGRRHDQLFLRHENPPSGHGPDRSGPYIVTPRR